MWAEQSWPRGEGGLGSAGAVRAEGRSARDPQTPGGMRAACGSHTGQGSFSGSLGEQGAVGRGQGR